jgi:hypothetical protein
VQQAGALSGDGRCLRYRPFDASLAVRPLPKFAICSRIVLSYSLTASLEILRRRTTSCFLRQSQLTYVDIGPAKTAKNLNEYQDTAS